MTDWIDGDEGEIADGLPLHAGVTVDLIRGNLLCAQENSFYDLQTYHHDGDTDIAHALATTNEYDYFDEWNPMGFILRTKQGSTSYRTLTLTLQGKCSVAGTATVRAYLRRAFIDPDDIDVDEVEGFVDEGEYAQFAFTTTSFVTKSDTVDPEERMVTISSSEIPFPYTFLILLAKASTPMTVTVRSLRIRESAT